jgi:HTH-type transcriptional regulator/antitoxin HigA
MDIKPIKTEKDYDTALKEIEKLFEAEPGTEEGDRLEILSTLVEAYEDEHYDIPAPDPIEAINYFMESRGLTRADLEPYIGRRARVSEILNRKRPLTLSMIQRLHLGLGIPAEMLVKPYKIITTRKTSHRTSLMA